VQRNGSPGEGGAERCGGARQQGVSWGKPEKPLAPAKQREGAGMPDRISTSDCFCNPLLRKGRKVKSVTTDYFFLFSP
jgi:hypothetical protein